MKNIFLFIGLLVFLCLAITGVQATVLGNHRNMALCLDGKDNNVRMGMGIIEKCWTLEAWIKGDGNVWKELEVIVGGGEYSDLNIADNQPLVVKDGKLCSVGAGLSASGVLDDKWHYVAATCDGQVTRLYLDGVEVDRADTVVSVLPGAIGVLDTEHTFGGLIDEVRVWDTCVSAEKLREWMNRPLERVHPCFSHLKGYYNFDDLDGETSVNWVGRGHQAYHIRNGRNDYKGTLPLAFAVENDNAGFRVPEKRQELFNAVTVQSEWDVDQGTKDAQTLKLRITVVGEQKPLKLTELQLDLSEMTSLKDITGVHVYYTGQKARTQTKRELFYWKNPAEKQITFRVSGQKAQELASGVNYFLVTFDVSGKAVAGNILRASVPSFKLDHRRYVPEEDDSCVKQQVTESSAARPDVVKVLQWNIWNGGVHLGDVGRERIIELIRATNADIVMMQEGYGAQNQVADTLDFHLKTCSAGDNLALFSRFPLVPLKGTETFKSNPAKVVLPNGREILLNDCWLRYAYRPEYTSGYASSGLRPEVWVAEDSMLGLVDIRNLLEKDINPYLSSPQMPVIVCGDFNSCSHLDWTAAARSLHYGYGPVAFPISRFMAENGFKDSFREKNPDEVLYQGGTVAAIYGQMQMARIDFVYYRGEGIRGVSSKIIRSAPEIDDVWASDHAAVLTVFEVEAH